MKPPSDGWDVVVKVKYGDTLRRFDAYVYRGTMDHNMNKLRAKIVNLFKFHADAELILTYTDEDSDVVTLVNDNELHDAVIRQHLNPLRINVQLKTDSAARSETLPHFDSSTLRTSSTRRGSQTMHGTTAIDEFLQSVLCSALSRLSYGIMSKATSPAPALAEFVAFFSKLGQSNVGQLSHVFTDAALGRASANSTGATDLDANGWTKPLSDHVSNCAFTSSSKCVQMAENNQKQPESGDITRGKGTSDSASSVDFNLDFSKFPTVKESVTSSWITNDNVELEKEGNGHHNGKPVAATSPPLMPIFDQTVCHKHGSKSRSWPVPRSVRKMNFGCSKPSAAVTYFPKITVVSYDESSKNTSSSTSPTSQLGFNPQNSIPVNEHVGAPAVETPASDPVAPDGLLPQILSSHRRTYGHCDDVLQTFYRGVRCDGCGMHPIMGPRFKSHVKENYDLCSICFVEMGNEDDYTRIDQGAYGCPRLFKDSYNPVLHTGVRCDGCGMHPIIGPRFKSNVKEDYDLCSMCFLEMGNEANYTRIGQAAYRCPSFLKDFYNPHAGFQSPHGCQGYGVGPLVEKLESCFIRDITSPDKTLMAPSTPFTKIWRMCNNGSTAWPSGTQLVWIGGNKFGERGSIGLEIPENGFPVGGELDIAVDFRAPSMPGHYISNWSLASPIGQKFGQHIWVLIQVENFRPSSAGRSSHSELNLNLPPESSRQSGLWTTDVNAELLNNVHIETDLLDPNIELVNPLVKEVVPGRSVESVQVDGLPNGSPTTVGGCALPVPEITPSSSFFRVDLSEPLTPAIGPAAVMPPTEIATGDNLIEQTLLRDLEEMGFKQIDLNKEVLRLNEYDLDRSLDDLCRIVDLDPLLEELQEMGFCDKELNERLLIKNGGSIKRVVLDLIAGGES